MLRCQSAGKFMAVIIRYCFMCVPIDGPVLVGLKFAVDKHYVVSV